VTTGESRRQEREEGGQGEGGTDGHFPVRKEEEGGMNGPVGGCGAHAG